MIDPVVGGSSSVQGPRRNSRPDNAAAQLDDERPVKPNSPIVQVLRGITENPACPSPAAT
jgi:hypothetical protein